MAAVLQTEIGQGLHKQSQETLKEMKDKCETTQLRDRAGNGGTERHNGQGRTEVRGNKEQGVSMRLRLMALTY